MRESKTVKILKFKNKTSEIAHQLLIEAKQNEPLITKDVKEITQICGAKVVGLRKKFKSVESLTRKLNDRTTKRKNSIEKVAVKINDVLRYTFLISFKNYAIILPELQIRFQSKGYQIVKIYNAWKLENTPGETGYRGINLTIISSKNQKFELQLHTKASYKLKTETHFLYEESRSSKTSFERKKEIQELVIAEALKLNRPKGI